VLAPQPLARFTTLAPYPSAVRLLHFIRPMRQFVSCYQASFNRPPTAFDAYAFDAALAIRATVETAPEIASRSPRP
jgi:hypothetical protein